MVILPVKIWGQEAQTSSNVIDTLFVRELIDSIKFSDSRNTETFKKAFINLQIDRRYKAVQLKRLGYYFFFEKKEYEKSIEFLDESILLFNLLEDHKQRYNTNLVKGNAYLFQWKHNEALEAYYSAQEINRNFLKEAIKEATTSLNIAIVRRKMGQLEVAQEVYKKALHFIETSEIKYSNTHVKMLSEVAFLFIDLEAYDSVSKYSKEGIRISELNNNPAEKANFYTADGIVLYHKSKYNEALKRLVAAERLLLDENVPEKRYLVNVSYYIAECFYAEKEYEKAINKMHDAVVYINESEYNREAEKLYNLLAKSYKAIGNESQSIYWYEKSIQLDKVSDKEKDVTVKTIHSEEKKVLDKEISILSKNKSKIIAALLFSFMLLLSGLIFYFKKQRTNKKVFNELLAKINTLESQKKETKLIPVVVKDMYIDDEKINQVIKGLERLEKQQFFLNADCSLHSMSKKIKTNTAYLSKIINTHKMKNFNDYINDLRIDYVLKRLKDDKKFRLFSIKSIATEVGYKSDYSFSKHFKIKTGLNPSYYIKNINKLEG